MEDGQQFKNNKIIIMHEKISIDIDALVELALGEFNLKNSKIRY
jgi:hypothetical protein